MTCRRFDLDRATEWADAITALANAKAQRGRTRLDIVARVSHPVASETLLRAVGIRWVDIDTNEDGGWIGTRDYGVEHDYHPHTGARFILAVARADGWTPRRWGCELAAVAAVRTIEDAEHIRDEFANHPTLRRAFKYGLCIVDTANQ